MPRKRPSVAVRWSAWKRAGARTVGASPLSAITFPASPLRGLVEIAPGADLTADPATWSWVDITEWVRHDLGISTVVGRRDQAGNVDPSRATLKLDNRDGRFSRRNPVGPYYGQLTRNTPIRLAVDPGDGMYYRYYGFVNEWPKRWDKSGNDSTVTIQCGGALRRLQRSQPLGSALRRSVAGITPGDFAPLAYWPMEDGAEAAWFAAATTGTQPMSFSGAVELASDSSLVGSDPLPAFSAGSKAATTVPAYTDTGRWLLTFAMRVDDIPVSTTSYMEIRTTGSTVVRWVVQIEPTSGGLVAFQGYNSAGSIIATGIPLIVDFDLNGDASRFEGKWFLYSLGVVDAGGGNSSLAYGAASSSEVEFSSTDTEAIAPGKPAVIKILGTAAMGVGHVAVFTDPSMDPLADLQSNVGALAGWAGELAHERVTRICREEGIPLHCVAGTSAALGPQQSGTVVDVLRDAERTDLGVLYEHEWGLGYQALSERYSQPVQLALDFDSGHVNDPPEADDSDLRFRNQWTVGRDGGSEYTVLSDDYNAADGLLAGQTSVNAYRDDQLQHIAGWLVHRDTADEDYWTGLKLSFARTPDIIPAWCSLPFGARLQVANPPTQADPGDIDAIVEGWSERWDQVSWTATLNTSPASVLEVPVWDDLGFLWDSGSSSLTSDITAGATSISVTTTNADDLWVTGAVAFDIEIGGEQLSVTNISGASSPQTFTCVRAVNGISKGHLANATVRLWTDQTWGLT